MPAANASELLTANPQSRNRIRTRRLNAMTILFLAAPASGACYTNSPPVIGQRGAPLNDLCPTRPRCFPQVFAWPRRTDLVWGCVERSMALREAGGNERKLLDKWGIDLSPRKGKGEPEFAYSQAI